LPVAAGRRSRACTCRSKNGVSLLLCCFACAEQGALPPRQHSHNLLILIHQLHLRLHFLYVLQLLLDRLQLRCNLVRSRVELGERVDVALVLKGDRRVGIGIVVLEL